MEDRIKILQRINVKIYMAESHLRAFGMSSAHELIDKTSLIRLDIHGTIKLQDSLFLDNIYTHI